MGGACGSVAPPHLTFPVLTSALMVNRTRAPSLEGFVACLLPFSFSVASCTKKRRW